jgi:hypothetical protein
MGQMMRLEIMPDGLDVVQFWRILGQPLDGEPMRTGGKRCQRELTGVDRTIVLDQHHTLGGLAGLGTIKPIQLLEMGDEVAAALGWAGVHDELACHVIERAQHRDLLGLARCRHTQVRPRFRPYAREVGMRQRLTFVAKEQNDVSGFSLLFTQLQPQADPFDLLGDLVLFDAVERPALKPLPPEPFEYAEWKRCRPGLDYHIEVGGHWYSVPFRLIREVLEARITDRTVEVFHRGVRVAVHARNPIQHRHTTVPEHMPSAHRRYADWTLGRLRREAGRIGAATAGLAELILQAKPHPEQGALPRLNCCREGACCLI